MPAPAMARCSRRARRWRSWRSALWRRALPARRRPLRLWREFAARTASTSAWSRPAMCWARRRSVMRWQGPCRRRLRRLQARSAIPPAPPFEPLACDVFITEATFGLPVFRHPRDGRRDHEASRTRVRAVSRPRTSGRRLFARQGAARHLRCCARRATTRRSICMARWRGSRAFYEAEGVELGELRSVAGERPRQDGRRNRDLPAERAAGSWSRQISRSHRGLRLGLDADQGPCAPARDRAAARHFRSRRLGRTDPDRQARPAAKRLLVTHGEEEALVHWARGEGIAAEPLHLLGYGDEEAEAPPPAGETASEPTA